MCGVGPVCGGEGGGKGRDGGVGRGMGWVDPGLGRRGLPCQIWDLSQEAACRSALQVEDPYTGSKEQEGQRQLPRIKEFDLH
jgi:hypothetical protein